MLLQLDGMLPLSSNTTSTFRQLLLYLQEWNEANASIDTQEQADLYEPEDLPATTSFSAEAAAAAAAAAVAAVNTAHTSASHLVQLAETAAAQHKSEVSTGVYVTSEQTLDDAAEAAEQLWQQRAGLAAAVGLSDTGEGEGEAAAEAALAEAEMAWVEAGGDATDFHLQQQQVELPSTWQRRRNLRASDRLTASSQGGSRVRARAFASSGHRKAGSMAEGANAVAAALAELSADLDVDAGGKAAAAQAGESERFTEDDVTTEFYGVQKAPRKAMR